MTAALTELVITAALALVLPLSVVFAVLFSLVVAQIIAPFADLVGGCVSKVMP